MVCHIGGQLGTKVVISALGMLALYMCFNGTGIWGGETLCVENGWSIHSKLVKSLMKIKRNIYIFYGRVYCSRCENI